MSYADKTLTCRDCERSFVFTAKDQAFYDEKGFTNAPSRCPECRAQHKASRPGGFGGGTREMHSVTCSSCGKAAQVPFMPRGDKPVFCSDCFQSQRR